MKFINLKIGARRSGKTTELKEKYNTCDNTDFKVVICPFKSPEWRVENKILVRDLDNISRGFRRTISIFIDEYFYLPLEDKMLLYQFIQGYPNTLYVTAVGTSNKLYNSALLEDIKVLKEVQRLSHNCESFQEFIINKYKVYPTEFKEYYYSLLTYPGVSIFPTQFDNAFIKGLTKEQYLTEIKGEWLE